MTAIGIDPGVSGGWAKIADGKATVGNYPKSARAMMDVLEGSNRAIVVIEKVNFQPTDAGHKRSAEVLIRSSERWLTCLELVGARVEICQPAHWRKLADYFGGSDKKAALYEAIRLYPDARSALYYKSGNGRWAKRTDLAEALLMAHAGLNLLQKEQLAKAAIDAALAKEDIPF